MSFSKCMGIVNRLDQRDQDAVLERLEFHQRAGVDIKAAQRMAVMDVMNALESSPSAKPAHQASFEVAPDPENKIQSKGWDGISADQRLAISSRVADAIIPKLLAAYGATGSTSPRVGSYQGSTNPSLVLNVDSEYADQISSDLGFILNQAGVTNLSSAPFDGGIKASAVVIEVGEQSPESIQQIYNQIRLQVQQVSGQSYANGQMVILNKSEQSGIETVDLAVLVDKALGSVYTIANKDLYYSRTTKENYNHDHRQETQPRSGSQISADLRATRIQLRDEATKLIQTGIENAQRGALGRTGGSPGRVDAREAGRARAADGQSNARAKSGAVRRTDVSYSTRSNGRDFTGFFSNISLGFKGKPNSKPYEPVIDLAPIADFVRDYNTHRGHFDDHIGSSIPSFRELQTIVGSAIARTYKSGDVLDIGASEGAFIKAISQATDGRIKTVALDPNFAMAQHFGANPVAGASYDTSAFGDQADEGQLAWVEDDSLVDRDGAATPNPFAGKEVRYYRPDRVFDVVHEAMVFQFVSGDRAGQVARAKQLMKPDGILILEEKFVAGQSLTPEKFRTNEAQKDAYKEQYFTKEEIAQKAKAVGVAEVNAFNAGQQEKEKAVVGMNDRMVSPHDLEDVLASNFKHVTQFWDSGNFKGYLASDSSQALEELLGNMLDTNSEFSTVVTPALVFGAVNFSARDQTESDAFKRWSNDAPLVTSEAAATYNFKTGEKVVLEAYHGTGRGDRVGEVFQKKRATSGPMAYFTSDPGLASGYATGKPDTSRSNEDNPYETWFKYQPKGQRTPVDIARAWHSLDSDTKTRIAERMPDIRTNDDGDIIYEAGGGDIGSYDWNLKQTKTGYDKRGNPLAAAVETWLNSGAVFGSEQDFMQVLKLAGFPVQDVTFDSPMETFPFVYKTYVKMNKPLVAGEVPADVVAALDAVAKTDRSRAKNGIGVDTWDKNTRTLKEWVAAFHEADNKYVWTSIPDKVTDVFRSLGYDGIIDYAGKGGGHEHPVYIPFEETQVKSALGNNGKFDESKKSIMRSARIQAIFTAESEQASTPITPTESTHANFYTDLRQRLAEYGPDAYTDRELVHALEGGKQSPGSFYSGSAEGDVGGRLESVDDLDERGAGVAGRIMQDVARRGEVVRAGRVKGADSNAIIIWSGQPASLGEYFTFGTGIKDQSGKRGFLWSVIPSHYVNEAPTRAELFKAYLDGKFITSTEISINDAGQGDVSIRGVTPESIAHKDYADHIRSTGQIDADGLEYLQFNAGSTVSRMWQREAARRFAMFNGGSLPDFASSRATGANPSTNTRVKPSGLAEIQFSGREIEIDDVSRSIRNGTSAWDGPEASRFDDFVYKMQNKMIDVKRVIESITSTVGQVADDLNVYLQEELFHGRAAKRTADFGSDELQPLMEQIARDKYTIGDVEEYLHALHAREANAVVAARNPGVPGLQDGGSGMLNATASAYFAALPAADAQKLQAIAAKVDAIIATTRQTYADYGLESQQTVDGWGQMFQHYIPLHREDKTGTMGIGQGFSVKGKETRGRTGSTRKVVDILANIAMERERAIVRGEKNRVSQALVGLATANPNPDFWTVGSPPSERVYDPKTNTVVDRIDPMYKSREHVLVAKVQMANGDVKELAVNFNEEDPRALRMAQSLKNLDAGNLEGLLGVSAKITRYFSAVNTQWNPVFGVVNLVRDVQSAMLNLDTTPLANKKTKIAKDTVSALAGIYQDMRAVRQGRHPTSAWAALWEEFQNQGGQTGYRQMFATSKERADGLQSILTPHGWMDNKWGKFFTANGTMKVPLAKAQDGAAVIFNWLSDYNESMENGVRLAAYKAGLDQGMSKQQAASLAKNLTVNFNRKGQVGQQAGAVYAFFNAAMQGTSRIGTTLFSMDGSDLKTLRLSPTGKKIVYGGMLLGAMQALALAAAGFDDEDPPGFVRERSLVIPTGGKTYLAIPMPQGFNVIPGLGRHLTEFALSGFQAPAKRAIEMVGMFAGSFNPIGNAGISIQTIAPTAIDPLVALTENRDFTGKPIARVSSNKALPGSSQYKDTASTIGKLLSEAINWSTGGNAYVAGALSPTPDQIDYLLGQVTGGVGREAGKVEQSLLGVMRGEEVPLHKIPLVGRFVGNAASQASQGGTFYNNVNKLNELETEVKGLRKDGKMQEAAALVRSRPDAYLMAQANVAERQLQRIRREKRELINSGASRELVKAKEEQATAVMTRMNLAIERMRATTR